MRYLISVSYDGEKLYGFERQPRKKTVQGELERVLTKINKTVVYIKGAGRTDRGVHAYDQKVHFDLNINITCDGLKRAMNSMLDKSIYVNSVEEVSPEFHARFDVKRKIYQYKINLGEYNPIIDSYVYNYNRKLNISKMKKASKALLGIHNFESFTSGERESYDSIIYSIKFNLKGSLLTITFEGKSFFRYMVRNLVGALILIGEEKVDIDYIDKLLNKKNIKKRYITAPPNGLYLMKVDY